MYLATKFWCDPNSKHLQTVNQMLLKMLTSVFDRVENIVGKGENAGQTAFFPFPTMFSKGFFHWVVKTQDHMIMF